MNREKLNAAIFEAARHIGITADQAERFVGTLEICGISLSALDAQGGEAVAWIASYPDGSMIIRMDKDSFDPDDAEMYGGEPELTPLYTNPSPTAPPPPEAMLKELREALREARPFVAKEDWRFHEGVARSLLARIDALIAKQPQVPA